MQLPDALYKTAALPLSYTSEKALPGQWAMKNRGKLYYPVRNRIPPCNSICNGGYKFKPDGRKGVPTSNDRGATRRTTAVLSPWK
jgi:hypothetical protein